MEQSCLLSLCLHTACLCHACLCIASYCLSVLCLCIAFLLRAHYLRAPCLPAICLPATCLLAQLPAYCARLQHLLPGDGEGGVDNGGKPSPMEVDGHNGETNRRQEGEQTAGRETNGHHQGKQTLGNQEAFSSPTIHPCPVLATVKSWDTNCKLLFFMPGPSMLGPDFRKEPHSSG